MNKRKRVTSPPRAPRNFILVDGVNHVVYERDGVYCGTACGMIIKHGEYTTQLVAKAASKCPACLKAIKVRN